MQEFPAAQRETPLRRRDLAQAQSTRRRGARAGPISRSQREVRTPGSGAAPPPPLSQACGHSVSDLELQASAAGAAIIAEAGLDRRGARRAGRRCPAWRIGSSGLQSEERRSCASNSSCWVGQDALATASSPMPAFDRLPVPAAALLASVHENTAPCAPFDARAAAA